MSGSEIIVGVTGGIAAFKSAAMVSKLVQHGYGVRVVMTQSAHAFIGEQTFAALTGRPVITNMVDRSYPLGPHIELARDSDLLCIVPATANFMGKMAHGIADDLLSTLYLCFMKPVLVAPAMNCEMWDKKAVQRSIQLIKDDGVHVVDPQEGWLSCRTKGIGRMAEPETIQSAINDLLKH